MERNIAGNIWTARVIPIILAGIVGYSTYVLVIPLSVDYILKRHDDNSAAIAILATYFVLLFLVSISFFRLVYTTTFDPPYVPLGQNAVRNKRERRRKGELDQRTKENGLGGLEYSADGTGGSSGAITNFEDGLELFYTKEVFVCQPDGKPKYCTHCAIWKPDRTHHCSASGRCIRKMDHFCPWVGGPVGENNFKFFTQFIGYVTLYTLHLLVVMSFYMWKQNTTEGERINGQFAAIVGLAGFFFMFTSGMTATSIELILRNLTQVEKLGLSTSTQTVAILIPPRENLIGIDPEMASRPLYSQVTYPLERNAIALDAPSAETAAQSSPIIGAQSNALGSAIRDQHISSNIRVIESSSNNARRDRLSERDLKATRTFAILTTPKGTNIWDLGTAIANWESVMGTNLLDSLLPVRRSPCCNHEDSESQFMVGPAVDRLRCSAGFTTPGQRPERGYRLNKRQGRNDHQVLSPRSQPNYSVRSAVPVRSNSTELRDLNTRDRVS